MSFLMRYPCEGSLVHARQRRQNLRKGLNYFFLTISLSPWILTTSILSPLRIESDP
jgi:hypothetical protein